jgi:hypothetical protein
MAVFEHKLTTQSMHRFLASNDVSFEASTEHSFFEAGFTSDGRAFLKIEKLTCLASIDLDEWVFTIATRKGWQLRRASGNDSLGIVVDFVSVLCS